MVYKIKAFLFLLLVFVHMNRSCAEKLPTGTGPSSQLSRIAYGSEASILEHPYMVKIWKKTEASESTKFLNKVIRVINWFLPFLNIPIIKEIEEEPADFLCGGTLISQKCILTAAHCVFDNDQRSLRPKIFQFYEGNDTSGEGILLPEVESMFHDDYDTNTFDKDVAILTLTEPVKDPNLKTVEIDYSEVNEGDTITVVGWGINENGTSSTTLKKTNITITNTEECQSLYDQSLYPWKITENIFCAKGLRSTSHCAGDTGGPTIRNGKQIGIASFGNIFCGLSSAKLPGAYTKLSSVRVSEFLRQTIANNC